MPEAPAVWCCSQCGAIFRKDFSRCPNDGAEIIASASDPLIGRTLGNYTIEGFIGEGGMGRVYRARHAHLSHKLYAIKVLVGDHGAVASMRRRFVHEAEIASRLSHPNLVGVVDFGVNDSGLPYIVMELVDGRVLCDLIDAGAMDPARVVALARGICAALAYAHGAGVIHRDLKPGNILVVQGADGEVPRITDFGLVLELDQGNARLTTTGVAMGTPSYAAPEQMGGKPLDARADLYALGMSMYEMLTGGILPWDGSPLEIATAKTRDRAPSIRERVPTTTVPPALDALVSELLARRPADRPASARDVIDRLDRATASGAIVSTLRTRAARSSAWWVVAIVGVAVVVSGATYWALTSLQVAPASPIAAAAPAEPAPAAPRTAPARPPTSAVAPTATPAVAPTPTPAHAPTATPAVAPTATPAVAPTATPAHAPTATLRVESPASPEAIERIAATPPRHPTSRSRARPPVAAPAPVAPPPPSPSIAPSPAPATPVVPVAPTAPAPAPTPARPVALHASITRVDVRGSLPVADVERAVRRAEAAIARCTPTEPRRVVAHLEIGESRRAANITASGGAPATNACIAAALAGVRTESAPDVGDVAVAVHIAFESR